MSRSFEVIRNAQQDQPDYPLHIDRSVLTQQRLNEWLGRGDSPKPPSALAQLRKAARQTARFFAPDCLKSKFSRKRADEYPADHSSDDQSKQVRKQSARVFATWLVSFFPFIATLRKYDVKNSFVNDLIAGITVGIMHVPQGMAYAMLATLPPVIGLYTSFFPALVYFFFGTSRHISMGTIAVVSLLTGEFLDKMVPSQLDLRASASSADLNHSFLMASNDSLDPTALRVRYATALTMTVGISQFAMGIFRMGSVIRYLSGPMTSGFTVGVATHVLTSQVTTLLGVKIPKPVGLFTVPRTYYEVIRAIRTANPVTIGLSACCILIIAVFKVWINPPVTRRIRVPIPIDLIIVSSLFCCSVYIPPPPLSMNSSTR
ncbi:unnamed protein product [Echinostoma caproni]|uniref:Sulfate_transp domain-containing protein n=1 Tax=Echinostoma caproni TaxID=27848 RepID=A0A183ADH9_9TREM|nr:unnamed protein product [Echinostoma caproni]